tara:strand:+ start:2574 stop:2741 length:168 start_codon:yes stop_codon:yes gene_type:complete
MHAPQIIMICLWVFVLTGNLFMHGKPRDNPNFSFPGAVFAVAVNAPLLWWGGFFG